MTDLTASRPNLDRISDRGFFGRSDDMFVLHESSTLWISRDDSVRDLTAVYKTNICPHHEIACQSSNDTHMRSF